MECKFLLHKGGFIIAKRKTITYLDIRQKITCPDCNGTGEVLVYDDEKQDITLDHHMFAYVCPVCKGKKFKMERRTVSLESFKGLKN